MGGIEPRKGSLDLLEAYAVLRERRPDVRLVFAGGETLFDYRDYRADFDRRRAELDVEPIVLGNVPDDDLPSLVAEAGLPEQVAIQIGLLTEGALTTAAILGPDGVVDGARQAARVLMNAQR